MTNRVSRRMAAAFSNTDAKERAAFVRLKQMKESSAQVPLSSAAAARALVQVSPAALRLLWGMVTIHSDKGGGQCIFEDAVRIMGGRKLAWRVLDELHAAALMRFNQHGRHELHPLFGSIAHRLFEFGHGAGDGDGSTMVSASGGQVVTMS